MDIKSLIEFVTVCDLTLDEIESLCSGYLDLRGERLEMVLGNGKGPWNTRIADLCAWADRQGMATELYRGALHYAAGKRAVQDWILDHGNGGPMAAHDPQQQHNNGNPGLLAALERRLDRFETNTHDRLLALEREIQKLAMLSSRPEQPISWSVVLAAIVIALAIATTATLVALVR